jgi:glutamyl/glutaminyl-tRNA synthetase
MNGRYLRELSIDELTERLEEFTGRTGLRAAVEISADKISTLAEFWPLAGFLFDGPADDPAAREKVLGADGAADALAAAHAKLAEVADWEVEPLEAALREVVSELEVKPKAVFQPVRVALAGKPISPGIFESLAVLGRDESLRRIDAALDGGRTSV